MHRPPVLSRRPSAATARTLAAVFAAAAAATAPAPAAGGESAAAPRPAATDAADYPLASSGPVPAPVVPPTAEELRGSIARGVELLLAIQRPQGAWGGPQKTKGLNIYAPAPGAHLAFRTGVTSLAVMALLEARPHVPAAQQPAVDAAVDRGQQWLLGESAALRRATGDALYNVWGHSYALHALTPLHARAAGQPELQARLAALAEYHVDRLRRYNFLNGGWGYYNFEALTQTPTGSPNSFTTATCLIALKEAEKLGVHYPPALVEKALRSLVRQRLPDHSFAYGEYLRLEPRMDINRPAGSLGRTQVCNLALRLYDEGGVNDAVIATWLNRLIARNGWLSIGRKRPIPHESHFGVAGYFFYYGHWYAALCIDVLPAAERAPFQDQLAKILLPLQEQDGSWWDYPLYDYHQTWGTAMAVSSLVHCLHD